LNFTEILFLGAALAVDVFGVSFAYGLIIKRRRFYLMMRLALICGGLQALMPTIGFFGAFVIRNIIAQVDYLLVFLIFTGLGLNIIREARNQDEQNISKCRDLDLKNTLALGIATSIDALVSGSMIYLTQTPLLFAVFIIGVCSFSLSLLGFNLNCCLKKVPEKYLQYAAGIILILLGLKNLLAHFL